MHIIADSGATGTQWILDNGSEPEKFESPGINPGIQTTDEIREVLKALPVKEQTLQNASFLYFYGAGCSSDQHQALMKKLLSEVFPKTEVKVNHDLLGAARAMLRDEEGLICILGTGSSSGLFNGEQFIERIPSLGYVLGDEGSGAAIGKCLLREYCYNNTPKYLNKSLEKFLPGNIEEILNQVYKKTSPNKFLASLTMALKEHEHTPYVKKLLQKEFEHFLEAHVHPYSISPYKPIAFCGSVAYYFRSILEKTCIDAGFRHILVERSPLNGLIAYHRIQEGRMQSMSGSNKQGDN